MMIDLMIMIQKFMTCLMVIDMQILLDTHYLLWYLLGDNRISDEVIKIINNPENKIYYSTVSLWEIEIKHRKHPDIIPFTSKQIADACLEIDIENLPIFNKHIFQLYNFKKKKRSPEHNDPFDLLLLAQAKRSELKLLTHNRMFDYYKDDCLLVY